MEVTANDAVRFYPWTIDNKYYSADINLCVVPNKFLITAEIAESVQAFVVYFDSTQVRFCFPWTLNKKLFCAFVFFNLAFSVSSLNVSFSVFVSMFLSPPSRNLVSIVFPPGFHWQKHGYLRWWSWFAIECLKMVRNSSGIVGGTYVTFAIPW